MKALIAKVLLHDRQNQRYYAGPGQWVTESARAMDLGGIIQAARAFVEEGLACGEILVDNGALPDEVQPRPLATPEGWPRLRKQH